MVRKKSLAVIVAIVSVLVLVLKSAQYSSQQKGIKSRTPSEYQSQYNYLNQWLDQKLKEWKPERISKMTFCAQHLVSGEQVITKTNAEMDLLFLKMLKETGINCVRLSIYPYYYKRYKERYDRLIEKIRADNLKLMVAYMVGPVSISSFEECKQFELNFTETFVKKHEPEFYAVVTEPITMEQRLTRGSEKRIEFSDKQWIRLVSETASLIKTIGPGTKVIASVNSFEREISLAKKFCQIEDVDIIGVQPYGRSSLAMLTEVIDLAEKQGKETWITETWLTLPSFETWKGVRKGNPYFNDALMAPVDGKWIKAVVYPAQKHHMKGISPFFTGKFVYYPGEGPFEKQSAKFKQVLQNQKRTETFYPCRAIIQEAKNPHFEIEPLFPVPPEYQEEFNQRMQQYNSMIVEWKPAHFHRMEFGSNVLAAGLNKVSRKKFALTQIDILADELKVDYIDFLPTLDVFNVESDISQSMLMAYDEVLRKAKRKGLKIHILVGGGDIFTEGNPPVRSFSWKEFKEWYLRTITQMMKRYQPEVIFVIADPWYPWFAEPWDRKDLLPQADSITPQMVADLAKEGAQLAKSIDPHVAVGVHTHLEFPGSYRESYPIKNPAEKLLQEVVKIKEVDVIGLYPIGLAGLTHPSLGRFANFIKENKKELWMTATSFAEQRPLQAPWVAPLAAKFILASVYRAQFLGYTSYSYGFTFEFISYDKNYYQQLQKPEWNGKIDRRTVTYLSYKNIINQIKKITAVDDPSRATIMHFKLYHNYPNPFNAYTTIKYSLLLTSPIELKIYNVTGHPVKTLVNERQHPGTYKVFWDSTDDNNKAVASGVYFYQLKSGQFTETRKCVLLR